MPRTMMDEARLDGAAAERRRAAAPLIHALIGAAYDELDRTLDEARREQINGLIFAWEVAAQDGAEITADALTNLLDEHGLPQVVVEGTLTDFILPGGRVVAIADQARASAVLYTLANGEIVVARRSPEPRTRPRYRFVPREVPASA